MWPFSSSSDSSKEPTNRRIQPPPPPSPAIIDLSSAREALTQIFDQPALPSEIIIAAAFLVGAVTTGGGSAAYRRYFKRIPNSGWVSPNMLKRRRWIKGVVTSVGDADNFRLYHTPGFGWRFPLKFRRIPSTTKDLKDQTIHIRMAGVDAPEASHWGRPAQPYSQEALQWLKGQIEGKLVYCQLLKGDQYSRIVAMPYLAPRILPGLFARGKCISMEMLRAGWVEVYEQAGAEYGDVSKNEFMLVQAAAQASRSGMWKDGTTGESPSEYKRRYRLGEEAACPPANANAAAKKPRGRGLWSRLFRSGS
ncbi:staphylococcal nuclease [Auriscalpium vulgare]|uniref:Staphylococcal nuclease n=1 Tax=Auriscalpium vulgare TaxID=40419 RepID=A0ACB8RDD0_9AGAM|nr:staphylococcal nuclease [Auriscalpium vulgare]